MLDSVHLERMGIPSVVVVVQQFVTAARAIARAQGIPDLPMVVVPQDYLGEEDATVRDRMESVLDEILGVLYVSAEPMRG